MAATTTRTAIATSVTPLTRAANTSVRWKPKVRRGPPDRAANNAASSASTIAPTSESTWPASASRASEPVRTPPIAAAASIATLIARAIFMRLRFPSRRSAVGSAPLARPSAGVGVTVSVAHRPELKRSR